ncbi:MAG: cell filamentation protein Fic [Alteromonadaceae bacterium]|nr:MAG: cell filamentation protein Fic [Alteromonadaceae bacterium]
MSYTPPFKITTKLLNLVAAISEQVGALKASSLDASPQLRKQNRIKTITGTLAIEGNTLTEEQVTAVLEGKPVLGSVRELAEVQGAILAYEALPSFEANNIQHLLNAHKMMMADILVNAGTFRDKPVGIHKGKDVVHMAPPAHRVSGLMADLLEWMKNSDDHPLIVSTVFHYEFEFIHPFIDGNGRMGRLWQTLILSKWQLLFLSLPLESVIKDKQQGYYDALEQSDNAADCTPFLQFMLSVIAEALNINSVVKTPVNTTVNTPVNFERLKTPDAILKMIEANKDVIRQEMAVKIGKNIRTISRALKKLQDDERVKRVGSDKSGHWKIMD